MHLTHSKSALKVFSMLASAWHLLLPIFLSLTDVYCDGTIATVQLFLDPECSQAEISAFEAQLNTCIVIPGATGVMIEDYNPCDSGFIFITGYSDSFCMRGQTNSGPNNTIPDRCFSGGGSSRFAAIQVYCIAQESPLSTTTLSVISRTPSSTMILSDVYEASSYTTTTLSIAPSTFSSSKTTLSDISETASSSPSLTTTAKPSSEARSPSATTAQTVPGAPSPFPTTTASASGGSNTSSGLSDNGKVAVAVSIGVSAAALVVGFLTWLCPNPCNRRRHSRVDEDQPHQHPWHGFPRSRSYILTGQYSSRQEMSSSPESD